MTGPTYKVLSGLAQILDAAGVGTWSPEAAYADGDTGIVLSHLPQTPDKVICLTDYQISADPRLTDGILGVQVKCRGDTDPGTAMDMYDGVYDAWQGLTHFQLGAGDDAIWIGQIVWKSAPPIGPDENGRHERMANYWIYFNRPTPRLE